MKALIPIVLLAGALTAGRQKQTFVGVIADETCAKEGHSGMQMGPTDAECARLCVMIHGDAWVLYDGKEVYRLDDEKAADTFAGQKVRVTGTLDAKTKTIHVDSIRPEK